jgi:hypothetical protein
VTPRTANSPAGKRGPYIERCSICQDQLCLKTNSADVFAFLCCIATHDTFFGCEATRIAGAFARFA